MMVNKFYRCACYFSQNIYLNELNVHVTYKSKEDFLNDYKENLKNLKPDRISKIVCDIECEINRRKNLDIESFKRKEVIATSYKHLHPSLFDFKEEYLDEAFLSLHSRVKNSNPLEAIDLPELKHFGNRIFGCNVFKKEFCNRLIEEIENFEKSDLPKGRPNSMNNYGVLLEELGFDKLMDEFRINYLTPIFLRLYPDYVDKYVGLDSHKVFIVEYKIDADVSLNYHYDNAEVTLNISLGKDFQDGELYFGPMSNDTKAPGSHENYNFIRVQHKPSFGIFHRGQQFHEANEISSGERYNLIIWLRSSEIRNKFCPMCKKMPQQLIEAQNRFGDGFTKS